MFTVGKTTVPPLPDCCTAGLYRLISRDQNEWKTLKRTLRGSRHVHQTSTRSKLR